MTERSAEQLAAGKATKTCTTCGEPKPETAFHRNGRGDARRAQCGACLNERRRARGYSARRRAAEKLAGETRWRTLQDRYGITREQYVALSAAQNDVCAMCQKAPESVRPLVVDHCHTTGVVRGLLCVYCNVAVGIYENHGRAAAGYLAAHGNGNPLLNDEEHAS